MMAYTKRNKVQIGFVQDSDADRLAILDEKGQFLSEEYTTALAAYYVLSIYDKTPKLKKFNKSVVVNLSTSRMIDDVAKMFGAKVYRTAVGEINVVEKLIKSKSVIGGEGNGGVIYPLINFGRDSLAGIGLILDCMAFYNESLSTLLNKIPSYTMLKTKFNIEGLNSQKIINQIKKKYAKGKINTVDGLKIDYPHYWFHIRSSNTEPILRLIIEATSKPLLNRLHNELKKFFT
jgi:phosphomannomutase